MKKFLFKYWVCGAGAECLSYEAEDTEEGVDKKDAQARLAKRMGCSLSFLDEGEYCTITEVAA